MERDRRNRVLLVVLAVLLVTTVAYRFWPRATSDAVAPASNRRGATATTGRAAPAASTAPDVHIDALTAERPKPIAEERNLFRFKPKPPPPAPPVSAQPTVPAAPVQAGPPPPPPLPPIPLKFIGIVEKETAEGRKQTYAVLRDDRGVYYGSEGDTVLGQYRIVKIGAESIEMSYLDGRGRQTIRQTGG